VTALGSREDIAYKCYDFKKNLRERDHLENPGRDEKIMLKLIFRKWAGAWTGPIWLGIGAGGGLL